MKTLNILMVAILLAWSESALAVREAADEVGIVVQGGITQGQTLRFNVASLASAHPGGVNLELKVFNSQGNVLVSHVFSNQNQNGGGIWISFFDVNATHGLVFGDGNGRAQLTGIVRAVDPNNPNKPPNPNCGFVASAEIFDNNTGNTLAHIPGLQLLGHPGGCN